ncbi:shikimate dehydrogenase [candidate division KSB1 bacterium]|nr:shikimate dehydrogenase [candidate division KSB1 bacterium]
MSVNAKTTLCGIIGLPVDHSMSPAIHNAAYQELGLNYVYLAFNVTNVEHAICGMQALNIRGFSVTMPHKLEVMKYLDEIDPVAQQIGAVNTVVNDDGHLVGHNTDWQGFIRALKHRTQIQNKNVVLLGAGGAARAIAFGIKQEHGQLTILNRREEIEMAESLAADVHCSFGDLKDADVIQHADIIIQATSVGMAPLQHVDVIDIKLLQSNQIVFDIVYNPMHTKLLKAAKQIGCTVIPGFEMLLLQGVIQFELWTGRDAPVEIMRDVLVARLAK